MKPSDRYLKIVEWSEIEAMRAGESLNSYCVRMLRRVPEGRGLPDRPRRPAAVSRRGGGG